MKNTLLIARILTWFNLIFWGGFLALSLLGALLLGAIPVVVLAFLLCAIPLHCYAGLLLQRSIRFPNVKLSNQTPVGIRFVGLVALFYGISLLFNCVVILRDPKTVLDLVKEGMPNIKQVTDAQLLVWIHQFGIAGIVLGLAIVINVVLNTRLLRWYYLVKQSDAPDR
ncbi:MAG TPA: hypothetical protein VNU70_14560 [Puia sp.]|jgi:hypothetical protein|nr:hypothetical protein [Puia sp.]